MIKDADGKAVDGYTVDAYFNIKGNGVDTNLFEAESPFQVWPTDYLYLTTSEDGGATWSVPPIVNARRETEQSLLVGLGRGMVTSTGRIIFTAYEYTNGDKTVLRSTLTMKERHGQGVSLCQARVRRGL